MFCGVLMPAGRKDSVSRGGARDQATAYAPRMGAPVVNADGKLCSCIDVTKPRNRALQEEPCTFAAAGAWAWRWDDDCGERVWLCKQPWKGRTFTHRAWWKAFDQGEKEDDGWRMWVGETAAHLDSLCGIDVACSYGTPAGQ